MSAAGYLAPHSVTEGTYCDRTHAAVLAFQDAYGLRADGRCDEITWNALIEASWSLGDRLLYLRSPNLRGDDVAAMQDALSRLGFDCGRVDGIFGPLAVRAVSEFQQNIGLPVTGVATPDTISALMRVGTQSGSGPGIAAVREASLLTPAAPGERRVVIGQFGALSLMAHSITRHLRKSHPQTIGVEGDAFKQAEVANRYGADAYLGLEPSGDDRCVINYYATTSFTSVAGRLLAERLGEAIDKRIPELGVRVEGMRLPILRETQMPAVLCCLGPANTVNLVFQPLVACISATLESWMVDPG